MLLLMFHFCRSKNGVPSLISGLTFLLCTQWLGCIPNLARTNARLEKGFDATLSVGANTLLPGKDQTGKTTQTKTWPFPVAELDLQYANKLENSSAVAIQLKVPMGLYTSALDIYYQFVPMGSWYFGVGGELGGFPGGYFCASHYFTEKTYITFTPRVLGTFFYKDLPKVMLNPQLALGWAGGADVAIFVSYGYAFEKGIETCFFCESKDDFRKQFLLSGVSLRF